MRSAYTISALLLGAIYVMPSFAGDHPHNKASEETGIAKLTSDEFATKLEKRFSQFEAMEPDVPEDEAKQKHVRIFKFKSGDELREISKDVEEIIVESGMLSNLAEMVADFAEDIEIEKGDKSFSFRFDGDTLGEIKHDKDDRVVLKSMNKEMTVEKETYIENGKTRTRIVIEMDGDGSDIDLDEVLTQE